MTRSRGTRVLAVLYGVGLLLASCVVLSRPAVAQTTGDLDGTVTDVARVPLPGVRLEVRSGALQGVRSATSDREGRFRFPLVPPGVYTVTAELPGFARAEAGGVRVSLGTTVTVPVTLGPKASASAEVTGEASAVDTATTRLGTSLGAEAIARLPLGRNYASVAQVVAGAGQDPAGLTVYGATGLENQYLIDGMNTTGLRYGSQGKALNAEFVQEVEVRTGGYEAEFGQVMGGNINVVTKSGGNELHGDLFAYYDSPSLAAADRHEADRLALSQSLPEVPRRADLGLDLGGPLAKDRLWFFAAYDRTATDTDYQRAESVTYPAGGLPVPNLVSGTDRARGDLFSGKLTLLAGPSQTLALSVFGDPTRSFERNTARTGVDRGPDSAVLVNNATGGTDLSARWDGFFGSRFAVQAQYGYHEESARQTSDTDTLPTRLQYRQGLSTFVPGSGPGRLDDETYRRNLYRLSGSAYLGDHELKAGLVYERLNSGRTARRAGGYRILEVLDDATGAFEYAGQAYFAKVPLDCIARTDGSQGHFGFVDPTTCNGWDSVPSSRYDPRVSNFAAFLQDSFRVAPNLTVNAGVRYEEQRLLDGAGNEALSLTGEWSPRVGVVWDPLGDGRSKLFASYGRYYQVIPQDIQVRALGGEVQVYSYNYTRDRFDPVADNAIVPYAYASTGDYVPPGIEGTYTDEILAGAELRLGRHWSVGLKGIYKALGRAVEDRCDVYDPRSGLAGLVPASSLATCVVMNVGEGTFGQIPDPANPDCFSDYPKSTKPVPCDPVKARRRFRGLQLDVAHAFADGYTLQASYLLSRLDGNYDGFVYERSGGQIPGEGPEFDTMDLVTNGHGRLDLDRTHQLKLSGAAAFPFGLQVGLVSWLSSGRPLSLYGYAPLGYASYRYLVPRGSWGEMSWTYSVDVHLEYRIRLGKVTFAPVVDVFNVTDAQAATNRNQVYNSLRRGNQDPPFTSPTNPTFGRDTAWQQPRIVRLGGRVSF